MPGPWTSRRAVIWHGSLERGSGWSPTSIQGRSRVETTPRGTGGVARGGTGAGAGALAWGGGAGVGVGSGEEKRSRCGPPANASPDRLRQRRKAPARPSASAASSHGHSAKSCRGALSGSGVKPETVAGSAAALRVLVGDDWSSGTAGTEDDDGAAPRGGSAAGAASTVGSRDAVRTGEFDSVRRADWRSRASAEDCASVDETLRGSVDARFVGAAVGVVRCGGWSAGRVTVPHRLKFCSSLGPTASAAGVLVAAAGALCAASGAGPSTSPAVQTATVKRNPPLTRLPLIVRESPILMARQAHARRTTAFQAQVR